MVDAPAASAPFQDALVTVAPVWSVLREPFQAWLTVCPPVKFHRAVQPVTADAPAVTDTSPWKPPGHGLTVR